MNNNNFPQRKHPRLGKYDYSKPGYYFLTICVKERKPILSEIVVNNKHEQQQYVAKNDVLLRLSSIGKTVEKYIKNIDISYEHIKVDSYVIMPDHVHILIFISPSFDGEPKNDISTNSVIRTLKRLINKAVGCSIWQESYYDHIIRNEDDLYETRKYILNNPLSWYHKNKLSN